MADEAENIRKQIRFLSGLIENAKKSRSKQEICKRQFPTRGENAYEPSHLIQHGKSRSFYQNKSDNKKSQYSWKKSNSIPVASAASNITGTVSKVKTENKVTDIDRTNSLAAHLPKQMSVHMIPSMSKEIAVDSIMVAKSNAATYPFHTSQCVTESTDTSKIINKSQIVERRVEKTVHSVNEMKNETLKGMKEISLASVSMTQANLKSSHVKTVNAVTNTAHVVKVDDKLKTLSNSLKDELRRREEQINQLKKNLMEQKSLKKMKQQLKEPTRVDTVKQNVVDQTLGTLEGHDQPHLQSTPVRQVKSCTSSPVRTQAPFLQQVTASPLRQSKYETNYSVTNLQTESLDAYPLRQCKSISSSPVGSPIARISTQDNFISKSPYKLVKCNSSPIASASACQKLDLGKNVPKIVQPKQLQTKYKLQNAAPAYGNKLFKNEFHSQTSQNTSRRTPVFKKTKYTLRRIKSEPGSAGKRAKTPTKFVKSRYSLKRVRRSLSNKSNEELFGNSRFSTVNTPKSHSQFMARGIKSKYKLNNITSPRIIKRKQHFHTGASSQVYTAYGKRHWRSSTGLHPHIFQRSSRVYHIAISRWARRQGYVRHTGYPTQYLKVSRYLPPAYFGHRRFDYSTRFGSYNRQKRLSELKKRVPFNSKLRTDHRQKGTDSFKMINGAVYRSSQTKLVKANPTNIDGSSKHRQMTGNPMKFIRRSSTYSNTRSDSDTNYRTIGQQSSLKTRLVAAQLMNKSIAMATAKYKKDNTKALRKKKYCMFYNRFGKCNRKDNCPFIHDPERIAVCTRFLRGTCKVTDCPFSHKVSKEKMPVCSYFIRGKCTRDDCPYLHVNVNRDAEICEDFVNGYCPLGDQCKKKHTLVCPVFAQTGSCPSGNKCKLQHRKTRKRKVAQSGDAEPTGKQIKIETAFTNRNSSTTIYTSSNKACDTTTTAPPPSLLKTWTKIIPVVGGERAPLVLDSSDEEAGDDDDLKVPFKDRKLPTYIPLIMKVTGKDGGTEAGSERTKGNNAMSPITRKQSLGSLTSSHTNRPVQ